MIERALLTTSTFCPSSKDDVHKHFLENGSIYLNVLETTNHRSFNLLLGVILLKRHTLLCCADDVYLLEMLQ